MHDLFSLLSRKNEFLTWLHELTQLCYEEEVILSTDHDEVIALFYKEGKTPEAALADYKAFLVRWNALQNRSY